MRDRSAATCSSATPAMGRSTPTRSSPTDRGSGAGGLRDSSGRAISIDGLWGIGFGNNGAAGPPTTLYFVTGPNDEEDGLFGSITAN
jgi:hypothetical protein